MSVVTGGYSSTGSMRFVRFQCHTCGRFMPHNGARDRQWLARTWLPGARSAEGVMVRRLSVASLDSGAESPVYVGEPSASAGRGTHANGDVSPKGAARCGAATADWMPPRQVVTGRAATRHKLRHVGHRPAKRKMVCKGHPCIYAADGNPMAWFASSLVVRCANTAEGSCGSPLTPMRPLMRADVHGREG